ncbi:C40 family peptidase [Streptomyces sp. NPDC056519]|uniref:C40 family peptidase n=1 Tax=Streptomyces sp. NPDC056519 TaxID=3345849 RepID=UPI00367BDBE2
MSPHTQHTEPSCRTPLASAHARRAGPARHRKPSRTGASRNAINLGLVTGVLGTVVAATPASAAEQPGADAGQSGSTLTMPVAYEAFPDAQEAAEQLRGWAHRAELRGAQDRSAAEASVQARSAKDFARQAERKKAAAEAATVRAASAREAAPPKRKAVRPGKDTARPGGKRTGVAAFARSKVGSAYVYGASSVSAFDCSGLVQAAYRSSGIAVPRTSQAQSGAYPEVRGELKPGDILYWGAKGSAYHVAIYVGGGKFVGAQNSATGVVLRDVAGSKYTGAVRPG